MGVRARLELVQNESDRRPACAIESSFMTLSMMSLKSIAVDGSGNNPDPLSIVKTWRQLETMIGILDKGKNNPDHCSIV